MLVHVRNSVCFRLRRRPPALRRPRPEQVGTFSLGFSCCLRTPENSRKSPQFHGKKDVFFQMHVLFLFWDLVFCHSWFLLCFSILVFKEGYLKDSYIFSCRLQVPKNPTFEQSNNRSALQVKPTIERLSGIADDKS